MLLAHTAGDSYMPSKKTVKENKIEQDLPPPTWMDRIDNYVGTHTYNMISSSGQFLTSYCSIVVRC
jgi:hypothetical protein